MVDENPPILNADVEFVRSAPLHVRLEFAGVPTKMLLREGETLFRFLEGGLFEPASEFWLPLETYHHLRLLSSVPEWAIWQRIGSKSPRRAALFCRATLIRRVYGFKGTVRSAGAAAATMENLIGAGMVWIPGLSAADFFPRCYSL